MAPPPFRYSLITDGSSDACLVHPINWLLRELGCDQFEGQWADTRALGAAGKSLVDRIRIAHEFYPAQLFIVHRDAEAQPLGERIAEIEAAVGEISPSLDHVSVVPVRMTEAWLLHDEAAIRRAAGMPRGKARLELPAKVKQAERLADPKQTLKVALLAASEATGRARKQKQRDFGQMRARVAELIDDYSPLRQLSAFERFEQDFRAALHMLGSSRRS